MKTTTKIAFVASAFLLFVPTLSSQSGPNTPLKFESLTPVQRVDARFRLFKTQNMWTQLMLDTRTGRLLQVSFTVKDDGARGWLPINDKVLVEDEKNAKDGRFTLYPTDNMWTFLLLDQENGRVWQCQYSLEKDGRFIAPISELKQ